MAGGIFGDGQRGGIFGAKVDPRLLQMALEQRAEAERQRQAAEQSTIGSRAADWWNKSTFFKPAWDDLVGGLTAPGDVMSGAQPTMAADPQTGEFHTAPELMDRAGALVGTLTLGAAAVPAEVNALRMGAEPLASKSHFIYNPPTKPPRLFEEDYKGGVGVDEAGNLTRDIEGNPLTARFIAGRRRAGEPDIGLSPADIQAAAERGFGARISTVPGSRIGGDAGRLIVGRVPETGAKDVRIAVNSSLTPERAERVTAHEVSHLIDELAGHISTVGLSRELRPVYNTLNTGRERTKHLTGPEPRYRGEDVDLELMAEAIRAYMRDPNYLKSMAPKTAEAIRAAVNNNPELAQVIQFNVGGVPLPSLPQDDEAQAVQRNRAPAASK